MSVLRKCSQWSEPQILSLEGVASVSVDGSLGMRQPGWVQHI